MSGRTIVALMATGVMMACYGCTNNSTSPASQPAQAPGYSMQPATTQPTAAAVVDSAESPALTIPVTPNNDKPGALDGVPTPQVGPSPEAVIAK
jgi:hypothetical protein